MSHVIGEMFGAKVVQIAMYTERFQHRSAPAVVGSSEVWGPVLLAVDR
ncbi:MAG: hypothetical protein ACJATN_000996 [Neolewinella sp.]|jgi:hypothetical protein